MAMDLSIGALRGIGDTGVSSQPAAAPTPGQATDAGFAEMLQNAATGTVGQLRAAEQVSMQALAGEADIRDVTDAVMEAQQNLQAAIAIRDKIVTAFLEISRMQI